MTKELEHKPPCPAKATAPSACVVTTSPAPPATEAGKYVNLVSGWASPVGLPLLKGLCITAYNISQIRQPLKKYLFAVTLPKIFKVCR